MKVPSPAEIERRRRERLAREKNVRTVVYSTTTKGGK